MGDLVMVRCEECDGEGHVERIKNYGNAGWYAARAARTGDEGPCYEDCECEECGGTGEVEVKCPVCCEPIEADLCAVCEGCVTCCTCTTCAWCGEKVPDGERWDKVDEDKLCEKCLVERHGPWCWEQGKACDDCQIDETCNDCAGLAARRERDAERAADEQ